MAEVIECARKERDDRNHSIQASPGSIHDTNSTSAQQDYRKAQREAMPRASRGRGLEINRRRKIILWCSVIVEVKPTRTYRRFPKVCYRVQHLRNILLNAARIEIGRMTNHRSTPMAIIYSKRSMRSEAIALGKVSKVKVLPSTLSLIESHRAC